MKRRKLSHQSNGGIPLPAALNILANTDILATVCIMLDNDSLLTVLDHFEPFRRIVKMDTIERVMKQLFGSRWKRYYDALVAHSSRISGSTMNESIWGLGYELQLPYNSSVMSYAVGTAAGTLRSMAQNCKDYDVSFIPGEPSNAGIDRIWFVENGRLLWIQYHSWKNRYHGYSNRSDFDRDVDRLNYTGTYADGDGTSPNLDGQILLTNPLTMKLVSQSSNQERVSRGIPGFGHEIWDLAAKPEPQCLWSHYWRANNQSGIRRILKEVPASRAFPVPRFLKYHYVQSPIMMRAVTAKSFGYSDRRPFLREHYEKECTNSIRFLEFFDIGVVIDVLHLEQLEFHGIKTLMHPTLSIDAAYLAAIVQTCQTSSRPLSLVIWKTDIPRTRILWKDGLAGLCDRCHWVIDKTWLTVHCLHHGTFAYALESSVPDPIDITEFVKPVGALPPLFFRVCGEHNDILIWHGGEPEVFSIVKFTYDSILRAERIHLSTRNRNWGAWPHLGYASYIFGVSKRYIIKPGGLHDFGLLNDSLEPNSVAFRTVRAGYAVLTFYEHTDRDATIAMCCNTFEPNPSLSFWLLTDEGDRELQCEPSKRIYVRDVNSAMFSSSGQALYLVPNHNLHWRNGWIVTFTHAACKLDVSHVKIKYDLHIALVPYPKSTCGGVYDYDLYSSFLARNFFTIERIERRHFVEDYRQSGPRCRIFRFNGISPKAVCLDSHPHGKRRPQEVGVLDRPVRPIRWIDVLQQKPRDLEYCRSICRTGKYAALSPDGRFLAYAAHRVPQVDAPPHVELRDLTQANQNPDDFRHSERSLLYALRLRRDYRRPRSRLDLKPMDFH